MTPLRWSNLKHMARSPLHYKHALEAPVTESPAMRIGAYTHAIVLGGRRPFAIYEGERRGKAWEAFKGVNENVTILTRAEADLAGGAADAVLSNKIARQHLDGIMEHPFRWHIGNRECSGTPDAHNDGWVTELKVTTDASPLAFPWHARRLLWPAQLAWYAAGLGYDRPALHFVAVEAKPPHCVQVYSLTATAIEQAKARWRGLFETLMVCESSGDWPGYCESILPFDGVDDVTLTIDGEEIEL